MIRLPFKLKDDGFNEVRGFLYLEETLLIIEVQPKLFGLIKEEKTIIEVETGAIAELRLKRGLFRNKLCLRPRAVSLFDAVPGDHSVDIEFKIAKKHRYEAEAIVDAVAARIMAEQDDDGAP